MDLVTESPGLHHLAEKIFSELEDEKLLMCEKVNDFWKRILDNPMFWLKKLFETRITQRVPFGVDQTDTTPKRS